MKKCCGYLPESIWNQCLRLSMFTYQSILHTIFNVWETLLPKSNKWIKTNKIKWISLISQIGEQLSCQPNNMSWYQTEPADQKCKNSLSGKTMQCCSLKAFSPRDAEEDLFWDTLIQTWSQLWEARVGKHLENSLNPGWGFSASFQDCVCTKLLPQSFQCPFMNLSMS